MLVRRLAETLVLGALLEELRLTVGGYELLDHWQQGEFHHDIVLRVAPGDILPGAYLIVATNCNGGVKEVLCFSELPARGALWKHRCPDNPEFEGSLIAVLDRAVTTHWFDPCELLGDNARSELRAEYRERQAGGGWVARGCAAKSTA
ncbi:hypothetical protein [Chondromyces crocatus]|uniref:Uncharacterized protein n=1 Tax=Chondromyces crocatus TaxID=52 RepID=A0A0K1EDA8_CHOCO|nr:hypothetical protein [Chondromyces crocatus]AKT38834.1 uncharacterized protein CMC5_029800 [Chondromyces crocatus]